MIKLINSKDTKVRILWFSDIHMLSIKTPGFIKIFLKSFKNEIIKLNSITTIDYVIISGDLSNKGEEAEFEKFAELILKPIFKVLKNAKLLVCPGNHDITIDTKFNFKKIEANLRYDQKISFLTSNQSYNLIFEKYTDFCSANASYFPHDMESPYKDHFMFGFYKDKERKIVFFLLNSAWFSLSIELLKYFLEKNYIDKYAKLIEKICNNEINQTNIDELQNLLTEMKNNVVQVAYDISLKTVEYGTQVVAINKIFSDIDLLIQYIEAHVDYFKITIMHHPENHLDWDERLNNNSLFNHLKLKSDIILSSHEHIRKEFSQTHALNEGLHLKSGAFIELGFSSKPKIEKKVDADGKISEIKKFDFFDKNKLAHSMFSVLDINSTKKTVIDQRVIYWNNDKEWRGENSKKYILKKDIVNFKESEMDRLQKKLLKIEHKDLIAKITSKKIVKKKYSQLTITIDEDDRNNVYVYALNFDFNLEELKKIIFQEKFKKIFFLVIDATFEEKNISSNDDSDNDNFKKLHDRNLALGKIKKNINKNFNQFRSTFFNQIEEKGELIYFENVSFILVVFPYWEIEKVI